MSQGYSLSMIYEAHREGLGISFSQFARYAKRFVNPPQVQSKPVRPVTIATRGSKPERIRAPKKAAVIAPTGFMYQPTLWDDDIV
jgi:hypothetical protein